MDSTTDAPPTPEPAAEHVAPGAVVRRARQDQDLTLAQLGERAGYSAAQVSRYERGITPMTDVAVLRRFADALAIPLHVFGLTEQPPSPERRHRPAIGATAAFPGLPMSTVARRPLREDGEDPVRRRQLLANLAATAAAAAVSSLLSTGAAQQGDAALGDLLADRLRDAMLGLDTAPTPLPADRLHAELAGALTDFHACRYGRLTTRLPR